MGEEGQRERQFQADSALRVEPDAGARPPPEVKQRDTPPTVPPRLPSNSFFYMIVDLFFPNV